MDGLFHLIEAFKWPLVVVIVVLVFMFKFHQPITNFINRIRGISPTTGVQTSDVSPQQSVERGNLSADELMDKLKLSLGANELMRSLDSPVLREVEENIKNELRTRQLVDSIEAIPVLIRYLAVARLAYFFEYIYGMIWGSQLSILNYLNTRPNGETSDILKFHFYDPTAKLYPDVFKIYPFETYLSFLKDSKFIVEEGSHLKITHLGREFLVYLVNSGKTMAKFY